MSAGAWPTNVEAAVTAWLAIKQDLRSRMTVREWRLWVFPARLIHLMSAQCMLIALPRSGRAIYLALGRKKLLTKLAGDRGYQVAFTVAPDEYEHERMREQFGRTFQFLDPDPLPEWGTGVHRARLTNRKELRQPLFSSEVSHVS